jgi:hypothetical protein
VEEVEAAEEDGVVLPSRVKLTREERRKARSRGGHHGLPAWHGQRGAAHGLSYCQACLQSQQMLAGVTKGVGSTFLVNIW